MAPTRTNASTPDTTTTSALALRKFRAVFAAVRDHYQIMEKQTGVAGAQIWAMSILHKYPGIGVGRLAQVMDVHQTTASNLVKNLTKAGYASIEKQAADRRQVQIYLLPAGQKVLQNAPQPHMGILPHALQQLDEATLTRLNEDVGRLLELIHTKNSSMERVPLGHEKWS